MCFFRVGSYFVKITGSPPAGSPVQAMIASVVASHEFSTFYGSNWPYALCSSQVFSWGNGRNVPATSCARLPPFSVIWSEPLLQRGLGVLMGKRVTSSLITNSWMTRMENSMQISQNHNWFQGYRGQTSPLMELEHHHLALVLTVRDLKLPTRRELKPRES